MVEQALQFVVAALPLVLLGLGVALAAVAYDQTSKGKTPVLYTGLATLAFALSLFSCGAFALPAEAAPADAENDLHAAAHQEVAQDAEDAQKGQDAPASAAPTESDQPSA